MIVKHRCPFCKKVIRVETIETEDRRIAKITKENMKSIFTVLGKSCTSIHSIVTGDSINAKV